MSRMEKQVFNDIFKALCEATLQSAKLSFEHKKKGGNPLEGVAEIGCYRALNEITRIFSEVGTKHYKNKG